MVTVHTYVYYLCNFFGFQSSALFIHNAFDSRINTELPLANKGLVPVQKDFNYPEESLFGKEAK